jgi:organic radical activating enzyme
MKTLIAHSFTLVALLVTSTVTLAANMYRFYDHNGVITMSKSLPPYAAQKGYDILDATSLRLIERVSPALTPAQITQYEKQQQQQRELEKRKQAEEKALKEQRRQQYITDQNLIARYTSEQDLINAHKQEQGYYKIELAKAEKDLKEYQQRLSRLQQQAGEKELSGQSVPAELSKRLAVTRNNISTNQRNIIRLKSETEEMNQRYTSGLERLRYLLSR